MIVFVRHGEAAASWGDHPDPGLSEKGWTQARAAAEQIAALGIEQIMSSPMQRCQDTAKSFSDRSGLSVAVDQDVSEIPTPEGVEDRVAWLRSLMSGKWHAAELPIRDWRERLIARAESLPDNTVVFSHFVAINALVGHLQDTDQVTVFRPDHCSLTLLEHTPQGLILKQRGGEAGTRVL